MSGRSQNKSAQAPKGTWQGQAHTPQGGLHSDVKSWVSKAGWQGYKSTPTSGRSRIQGTQLGWQSRRHTEVLQDLAIKAHRP
jgi:hypothetical protein